MPSLGHNHPGAMPQAAECAVRAVGVVEAQSALISALRRKPAPAGDPAPFVSALKYADDQTVVSLAAVLQAIHEAGLERQDFTDWGVVAGPCYLGRETLATAFKRFARQGAMGVSPLLIPYLSQHAVAGTISLPLRIHGPNLGVGGDRGSMVQALLSGLTLQHEHRLPGVWVVCSEWDQQQPDQAVCRAVAMALVPLAADAQGLRLRFLPLTHPGAADDGAHAATMAQLAHFLANRSSPTSATWNCPLPWNGRLELTSRTDVLACAA